MSVVQERYNPIVVAANTTVPIYGNNIGCFLCTATGTITLVANANDGKAETTLLSAMAVTAGFYYPLPFYLGKNGGVFTTASNGAGVLGV